MTESVERKATVTRAHGSIHGTIDGATDRASGPELLRLAEHEPSTARSLLNALSPTKRAVACLQLRPHQRGVLMDLLEEPEEVVLRMPEVELLQTIRATGFEDAAWLLAHSTPEQRVACIDIDCWSRSELQLRKFREWTDALILAGGDALLRSLHEFDTETWVLALRDMADIVVADPMVEPYGHYTEDGVVFYRPRAVGDRERIRHIFCVLISESPKRYWQLIHGVTYEDPYETADYALRWRDGRMADLGFPERDQAMEAYRPLAVEQAQTLEVGAGAGRPDRVQPPLSSLPRAVRGSLVARALRELEPELAGDVLGNVLAVANTIAIADQLDLSAPESLPKALRKAIRGIDQGLRELSTQRSEPTHRVLASTRPLDLFRIGMTSDAGLALEPAPEEDLYEELLDLIGIQPDEDELSADDEH